MGLCQQGCMKQTVALGCPDVFTFAVTSRWPNLSRVPGGKTYVICHKSLWIAVLQEKLSVYLFLFAIL